MTNLLGWAFVWIWWKWSTTFALVWRLAYWHLYSTVSMDKKSTHIQTGRWCFHLSWLKQILVFSQKAAFWKDYLVGNSNLVFISRVKHKKWIEKSHYSNKFGMWHTETERANICVYTTNCPMARHCIHVCGLVASNGACDHCVSYFCFSIFYLSSHCTRCFLPLLFFCYQADFFVFFNKNLFSNPCQFLSQTTLLIFTVDEFSFFFLHGTHNVIYLTEYRLKHTSWLTHSYTHTHAV